MKTASLEKLHVGGHKDAVPPENATNPSISLWGPLERSTVSACTSAHMEAHCTSDGPNPRDIHPRTIAKGCVEVCPPLVTFGKGKINVTKWTVSKDVSC
ncbi:hypothetical protein MJO29_008685 [Puccinia striiformis f. sp. tritici]|nr:hypothetical protein MJO29_008685 [Puccinia striiformis f. sp. tritici]